MSEFLTGAEELSQTLEDEMSREAEDIQSKLNRGEPVTIDDIKEWRRSWIDKAVKIRELAKEAKAAGDEDESYDIKELAIDLENMAKDFESELKDDAYELEEAQERGGILTHKERIERATKEGKKTAGFTCPSCGAAIPESTVEICAYCSNNLKENGAAVSTGWAVLVNEAESRNASSGKVFEAAKARIEALQQTYNAQLEMERKGLLEVLEAGKRRTDEFDFAMEDAGTRLDRIWERIREVGQKAGDRLSDMEADEPEEKINEFYDRVCELLDSIRDSVMSGIERKAALAWDEVNDTNINCSHCNADLGIKNPTSPGEATCTSCGKLTRYSPIDTNIYCKHCGADLGIKNPSMAGEATCTHCDGLTRYSPHLSSFEVDVNRMIDKQMDDQQPVEEQFQHWKQVCITKPTEENIENLKVAARAMYDKQLFYIKDEKKRKEAVDRYVSQAIKEVK